MPSAEVDDDGPEVGAGGTCCSCCWSLGGSLASLNISLNLASCLRISIFCYTCSSDMHTICNAGGSGYKNIGSINALNSMQYRSITMRCISNNTLQCIFECKCTLCSSLILDHCWTLIYQTQCNTDWLQHGVDGSQCITTHNKYIYTYHNAWVMDQSNFLQYLL